jgi:outer membrane protein
MKNYIRAAVAACAMSLALSAMADKGEFAVRLRALYMKTDSDTSPNLNVNVEDRWIPEIDFAYWMTDNLALELVLTYPQKHNVDVGGAHIGSVKHLPPTLMLQYHFLPKQDLQPYVGAGINYTRFSSVNLNAGTGPIQMDDHSTGWALQAGFDYRLSKTTYLNVDVKKVKIDPDLRVPALGTFRLDIDPWLVGMGIGWRF